MVLGYILNYGYHGMYIIYIYIYIYNYSNYTRKPPVRPHNFLGILKEYKFRPPLNFTGIFNWEDQQGY